MDGKAKYGATGDFIFREAVKFLRGKKALPKEAYELLDEESRMKAFTVSGYTSLEVLNTFLETLAKAVEEGETKENFQNTMNHFLEDKGYIGINPWKADVVFRTNVQTAYNAGHYRSMTNETTKKLRPFWQYRTAADGHVREEHAVMHGRVYRCDDKIWDVWYPPNGFRCRCGVVSLSERQLKEKGLKVETKPPIQVDYSTGEIRTLFPDKGFSNNPAKGAWKPDLSGLSPELKKIYKEQAVKRPISEK